jgi:phage shock protein A
MAEPVDVINRLQGHIDTVGGAYGRLRAALDAMEAARDALADAIQIARQEKIAHQTFAEAARDLRAALKSTRRSVDRIGERLETIKARHAATRARYGHGSA